LFLISFLKMTKRGYKIALFFALWTFIGFFFSTQVYLVINVIEHMPFSFVKAIRSTLPDWYTWAAFSLIIVKICDRLRHVSTKRALLLHSLASIAFGIVHIVIGVSFLYGFELLSGNHVSWIAKFKFNLLWYFHWNVLIYWAIVAANYAGYYYRSDQERKMTAAQLEAQLAQAQLTALKMQLHPHFLFNTLNSISVLINKDVQSAKKMLVRLADFLRLTLANSGEEEVPLQTELEFLKTYLEIEKVRFQDRLTVDMEIQPETMHLLIPNLILQPIVENAIRHGIAPRSAAGIIRIRAVRENGMLQVKIEDNGPGVSAISAEGIGLSNIRARLQQHYATNFLLSLDNRPEGGLSVLLEIPANEGKSA
jgi:two-component system LytT family sensor kinase